MYAGGRLSNSATVPRPRTTQIAVSAPAVAPHAISVSGALRNMARFSAMTTVCSVAGRGGGPKGPPYGNGSPASPALREPTGTTVGGGPAEALAAAGRSAR